MTGVEVLRPSFLVLPGNICRVLDQKWGSWDINGGSNGMLASREHLNLICHRHFDFIFWLYQWVLSIIWPRWWLYKMFFCCPLREQSWLFLSLTDCSLFPLGCFLFLPNSTTLQFPGFIHRICISTHFIMSSSSYTDLHSFWCQQFPNWHLSPSLPLCWISSPWTWSHSYNQPHNSYFYSHSKFCIRNLPTQDQKIAKMFTIVTT